MWSACWNIHSLTKRRERNCIKEFYFTDSREREKHFLQEQLLENVELILFILVDLTLIKYMLVLGRSGWESFSNLLERILLV